MITPFVKAVTISPDAIELFLQLTNIAEKAHHHDIPRHEILEELALLPREQINLVNEQLRLFKDELKVVADA